MDQQKFRRPSSSGYSSKNTSMDSGNTSLSMDPCETAPEGSGDPNNLNMSTVNDLNQSGPSNSESKSKLVNVPKYKAKVEAAKPLLGFEFEELKPVRRTLLDVDVRFFPTGIQPGSIIELGGDEGTGKTFLITYIVARVVLSSPTKTALLIDTQHHFSYRVLITMLSHFDESIMFDKDNYALKHEDIIKGCSRLRSYMERITVLDCVNSDTFLTILGPGHSSPIEKMLLTDPNLSLVAIDSIDDYSHMDSLKNVPIGQYPNFLHLICHAVAATKTPVICSVVPSSSSYALAKLNARDLTDSDRFGPRRASIIEGINSNSETEAMNNPDPLKPNWYSSNIMLDYTLFTHVMYIKKLASNGKDKPSRCAYLRSKQSPKTALFSVVNHRAKFSIFSDMLFVAD